MPTSEIPHFPEDPATLQELWRAARVERHRAEQRAAEHAARQGKRADDLYLPNLPLPLELDRSKKWYYGPRADRLQSTAERAQARLNLGEDRAQKPRPREGAAATRSIPNSTGRNSSSTFPPGPCPTATSGCLTSKEGGQVEVTEFPTLGLPW